MPARGRGRGGPGDAGRLGVLLADDIGETGGLQPVQRGEHRQLDHARQPGDLDAAREGAAAPDLALGHVEQGARPLEGVLRRLVDGRTGADDLNGRGVVEEGCDS